MEMAEGKQKKRIANQALDVELLINSEVKFELPEFKDWTLLLSIPLRVFLKKNLPLINGRVGLMGRYQLKQKPVTVLSEK